MTSLLDQALAVSPTTRKLWLRNLTTAQRTALASQITEEFAERGEKPPMKAARKVPGLTKRRYNSIKSGSFVNGQRVIRVGRHVVLLPAAARYKRTRDTLAYVYHKGIVTGYRADGAKLRKLRMDAETQAHIARTLFNART